MPAKIGVVTGSLREGSFNKRLARLAAEDARAAGAEVTEIDLGAFDLPVYRHEIEAEAFPEAALALKRIFQAQDGLLFSSPEYNGSVSPLLKNAIDWVSRPTDGEGPIALSAYRGKAAGMMAASVSPFGGLRGVLHLRQILCTVQLLVVPEQVLVPFADRAFDGDDLVEEMPRQLLKALVGRVVQTAAWLGNS